MTKKVAFCGTRGIPANYGGFETAVDEITRRFVLAGVACDVYCRSQREDNPRTLEGRDLVYVKGSSLRKLDTFVSSFQTAFELFQRRTEYQHVFWFNNANFPGIILSLLMGMKVTVNTDGLEWRRRKWSAPFKAYYYFSSAIICLVCDRLISDSKAIQKYYLDRFRKRTLFIPYGSAAVPKVSYDEQAKILETLNLTSQHFLLQITRIEPDNLPLEIAIGFVESGLAKRGFKLVIVGLKEETDYARKLKDLSQHEGVVLLPAIYDQKVLYSLRNNCFIYAHGNSVGGTNPALLEAMGCCPRVIAIESPFSREVLDDSGYYFNPIDISASLVDVPAFTDRRSELQNRVRTRYQWDAVAESYLSVVVSGDATYNLIL